MITIFSTCKPFVGDAADAQYNALRSWAKLAPDVEIVIFGDDWGAAGAARIVGGTHVPDTPCYNRHPYLPDMLRYASSPDSVYALVNADIILMDDLKQAIDVVTQRLDHFLLVGQRWDVAGLGRLDFDDARWQIVVRKALAERGKQARATGMDYFVWRGSGLWDNLAPLAMGCYIWDTWLMWHALRQHWPTVDVGSVVRAVHQAHPGRALMEAKDDPCRCYNRGLGPREQWRAALWGCRTARYELMPGGGLREREYAERMINKDYIFPGREIV